MPVLLKVQMKQLLIPPRIHAISARKMKHVKLTNVFRSAFPIATVKRAVTMVAVVPVANARKPNPVLIFSVSNCAAHAMKKRTAPAISCAALTPLEQPGSRTVLPLVQKAAPVPWEWNARLAPRGAPLEQRLPVLKEISMRRIPAAIPIG